MSWLFSKMDSCVDAGKELVEASTAAVSTVSSAVTRLVENGSGHQGALSPLGDETWTTISIQRVVGTHMARCGQVQGTFNAGD